MTELERLRKENAELQQKLQETQGKLRVLQRIALSMANPAPIDKINSSSSQLRFGVSYDEEVQEQEGIATSVLEAGVVSPETAAITIKEVEELEDVEAAKQRVKGKTALILNKVIFSDNEEVANFLKIVRDNETFTAFSADAYFEGEGIGLCEYFVSYFKEYKKLRKIDICDPGDEYLAYPIVWFNALENYPALTELEIGDVEFDKDIVKAFCAMLKSNPGLVRIGLKNGYISDLEDLRVLLGAMNEHPGLKNLSFSIREQESENIIEWVKTFAQVIKNNKSWITICLDGLFDFEEGWEEARQVFVEAIENNTCLREVTGLPEDWQSLIQPYLDRNKQMAAEKPSQDTVSSNFSSSSSSSLNASTIPLASDKGQDSTRKRRREIEKGKGSGAVLQQRLSRCFSTFLPPPQPSATLKEGGADLSQGYNPGLLAKKAKKVKKRPAPRKKVEEGSAGDLTPTQ